MILALVGATFAVKGFQTYKDVRKSYSKKQLAGEIQLTKILSLTHQMDIELHFDQGRNNLVFTRTADYVPPKLKPYFNHPIRLAGLTWEGESTHIFYANNPSSFMIGEMEKQPQ